MSYEKRIRNLDSVDDCLRFAMNAAERGRPDLECLAKKRAIELRADAHGASSDAEKEALQAIYAYEEILSRRNGKPTKASRTWQMVERHGILQAVERAVNRSQATMGFDALDEMGLREFAFEAVILRHPGKFSDEAVAAARERLLE